jgi:hypothetical protein
MENEAWPTPQTPAREPLPRVEDLPVSDQGYDQESVKAAFDSFYRHAAQLDAALRTLEAVDSFHRQAASLRADLRTLRASGWTQQSWTQPPSYGYDLRAPHEGVPPGVWRVGGEVAFLVAAAVALGVAKLSWWVIVLGMAGAFAIVCIIEWLAGREPISYPRVSTQAPVHPLVEAGRTEDTDEHDSRGWTAFEEAQEPSDAMTIIGAPQTADEPTPDAPPAEEPEPEPEVEVEEPELPPAAEADSEEEPAAPRRRWRGRSEEAEEQAPEPRPEPPRNVRVLPADENRQPADPWEQGFDTPEGPEEPQEGDPEEQTQDRLLVEGQGRRRFRRR